MNVAEINLQSHGEGTAIPVLARPGGRRNAVLGVHDGHLKVSVSAAPEKGKANKAIVALLADLFGVPKSSLDVISGLSSSRKRILIRGASLESIRDALKQHGKLQD